MTNASDTLSIGYCQYLYLSMVRALCCCCVRRFDTKDYSGHWLRRNMQKLRKLKVAQDKLEKELEVEDLIN